MAEERDYYEILGVSKDVSEADLKNAFRQLVRKYHPDVNKEPGAEERFKEINEAYQVLSDPDKRAAYDRYGKAGVSGMGGAGFGGKNDAADSTGDFGVKFHIHRVLAEGAEVLLLPGAQEIVPGGIVPVLPLPGVPADDVHRQISGLRRDHRFLRREQPRHHHHGPGRLLQEEPGIKT